jgi:hypothetical protein
MEALLDISVVAIAGVKPGLLHSQVPGNGQINAHGRPCAPSTPRVMTPSHASTIARLLLRRTAVDLPAIASGGTQRALDAHHDDDDDACAVASGHSPAEALHLMAIWGTV